MARENQGLQIALIIFVMTTIVLGVTTYMCYRKFDDAAKAQATAEKTAGDNERKAKDTAEQADKLKKMIGVAVTETVPAIEETFKKDMEKYGANFGEEDRFYTRLLVKMQNTINERNGELADAKAEVPKLQDEHRKSIEAEKAQAALFLTERDKASADAAKEQAKFQEEIDRRNREQAARETALQAERTKAGERLKVVEARFEEIEKKRKDLEAVNDNQAVKIRKIEGGRMEGAANGEITWVNQRSSTVWINLGRADGLMRQVTFSVYSDDVTDMTAKDASKAKIEVTQILGDHLAQARVVSDEISRPILPRDKIYTPLWSPGERRHFALAGTMDLDGDGKNDLEAIKNIITINGGVVDCYADNNGKQIGKITVNTNCLIMGKRPDEKSPQPVIDAFTKIRTDADQLRLQQMQLGDLLQQMGWTNTSPVVRFGRSANPKDFRAKADPGVPKKSTGSVSDVFDKRQPPKAPVSAY